MIAETSYSPAQVNHWRAALDALVADIESWSESRGWLVRRDEKTVREGSIEPYAATVLTVQTPQVRLRLDPVGLDVVGGGGRVDLYAWPSETGVLLVEYDRGWRVLDDAMGDDLLNWNEATFAGIARRFGEA